MSTSLAATRFSRPTASILGTLLVFASAHVLASSGIDRQCPTMAPDTDTSLLEPAYRVGTGTLEAAADVDASLAQESSSENRHKHPAVASRRLIENLLDEAEHRAATKSSDESLQKTGLPPTATRLPGIDDEDMPRFRRHMFRTDI